MKKQIDDGEFIAPKKIPTFAEAATTWLEGKQADNYRPGSINHWESHLTHLRPSRAVDENGGPRKPREGQIDLGAIRLDRISVRLIENIRDELRSGGELSAQTVNKILTTLGAVLADAKRLGQLRSNPMADVKRARLVEGELNDTSEGGAQGEVTEDDVLSPAEITRLLDATRVAFDRALLTTAC